MKQTDKKNKVYSFLILFSIGVLLLFSIYYFSHYLFPDSYKDVITLEKDWTYYTDSNREMKSINRFGDSLEVRKNETLYTHTYLPSNHKPVLLLKSYYQFMRIYINDDLVYEDELLKGKRPGTSLHFIDVSKYTSPTVLKLEITSPYQTYSGFLSPVYMGETNTLYAFILREAFLPLFYLFLCTTTGILLIILFFIRWRQHKQEREHRLLSAFFFGLFSILWGFFCISRENIIYLLFPAVTASLLAIGLHIIYFIPLMGYFYCHISTLKRFAKASLFTFCGMAGIAFLLQAFRIVDFPDMLFLINPLQDILFIPYFFAAFYEYKKGNAFVKHILPGIFILILTAVGTIVDYYAGTMGRLTELFIHCTFIFILIIWFYYIKGFYQKWVEETNERKALLLKDEMTTKNFNEMTRCMNEIRIMRHEMNHHIGIIQILCKEPDNSKISNYLNTAAKDYSSSVIQYSNNILVDSILSTMCYRAKASNITIDHQIRIPDHLSVKDADLFSLLMNMLENAFEAVLDIADENNRYIKIKMLVKNQFLLISCKNNYNKKIHKNQHKFITTKKEPEFHGYGITIMKSIVQKYNSMLHISYDENIFCVKTVIPIQYEMTGVS